jgi:REP element-mobilizing transposase RayT
MLLNDSEKERFRKIMRAVASFAGVEVMTYAFMTNHLHLLLMVPPKCDIAEKEVMHRIKGLYGRVRATNVSMELRDLRDSDRDDEAAELLAGYTYRMNDLSQFMKMVMQRFTQSYNKRHNRRGHLWEQRFKSVLVEGKPDAISTMAAYIDLNPVRAGIVNDPKAYHFCGYGEAVAGNKVARRGMKHICRILDHDGNWASNGSIYRKHLFMQAGAHANKSSAINHEKIQEVLDVEGRLSKAELLHCKIRYLSDGVVFGGKVFVEDIFQKHRGEFGLKRKTGARKPRFGQWDGLCTMRDLRLKPITLSPPL